MNTSPTPIGNRPASSVALTCDRGHTYFEADAVQWAQPTCPTCADLSMASDLWKDEHGCRPHGVRESYLLGWYRSLPGMAQ